MLQMYVFKTLRIFAHKFDELQPVRCQFRVWDDEIVILVINIYDDTFLCNQLRPLTAFCDADVWVEYHITAPPIHTKVLLRYNTTSTLEALTETCLLTRGAIMISTR